MASTRATRGSASFADELASMTIRDRLVFAQAVYEFGAGPVGWPQISKLLSQHPLLTHVKHIFSTQNCPKIYNNLMTQAALQRGGSVESKKAPTNLKLAEHFYRRRILELKEAISSEETKFRTLISEIDEIRSGKWDEKIRKELGIQEVIEPEDEGVIQILSEEKPAEDVEIISDDPVQPLPIEKVELPPAKSDVEFNENSATVDHVSVIVEEASESQEGEDDSGEAPMEMSSPLVVPESQRPPSPLKSNPPDEEAILDSEKEILEANHDMGQQGDQGRVGEEEKELEEQTTPNEQVEGEDEDLEQQVQVEKEGEIQIKEVTEGQDEEQDEEENDEEREEGQSGPVENEGQDAHEEDMEETIDEEQMVNEEDRAEKEGRGVSEQAETVDEDMHTTIEREPESMEVDEQEAATHVEARDSEEPNEHEVSRSASEEPKATTTILEEQVMEVEPDDTLQTVPPEPEPEREHEPMPEVDNRAATRSSARLRSKAHSPQRQTAMVKDKHRKQSLKPVSRDSQVSRTSRRSISRVEEPINTSGQPSRQESAQREGTEREETPIHIEEEQEEAVEEHVEIVSRDTTPPRRETGKRKAVDIGGSAQEHTKGRKRVREDSEPAIDAVSPAASTTQVDQKNPKERKRFQNVIGMLHTQIATHRSGTIFHNPIKRADAPDYYDLVKRPTDLKTIRQRVRDGQITTSSEYTRDIFQMFANSLMYNRPTTDIYEMAEEMMQESEAHINTFRQTEGFAQARTRNS